jgi:hypothetical protein
VADCGDCRVGKCEVPALVDALLAAEQRAARLAAVLDNLMVQITARGAEPYSQQWAAWTAAARELDAPPAAPAAGEDEAG